MRERTKLAAASRPRASRQLRPRSPTIPAAIKRAVWKRDGGRCAFVGANDRCSETGFLEFHHVMPYADGGDATVSNIELRCRAHNAYEAEQHFGTLLVREARGRFWSTKLGPDLVLRARCKSALSRRRRRQRSRDSQTLASRGRGELCDQRGWIVQDPLGVGSWELGVGSCLRAVRDLHAPHGAAGDPQDERRQEQQPENRART